VKRKKWAGRRLPPYVIEDVDRYGNVRVYLRKKGQKKIRLHGVVWSEAFMVAYQAALQEAEQEAEDAKKWDPS
jgi:hypothetical protein